MNPEFERLISLMMEATKTTDETRRREIAEQIKSMGAEAAA